VDGRTDVHTQTNKPVPAAEDVAAFALGADGVADYATSSYATSMRGALTSTPAVRASAAVPRI
jgi:hypothetical protein